MIGASESLLVTGIKENSAAAQSGIEVGDQIMDFEKVADLSVFLEKIRDMKF